jgi:hypothetical protein
MALTPIDYTAGQDSVANVYDKINAIITAVNELQGGTADQIYKKTNGTDFAFEACNSIIPASGTANLKVKVIEIGDWNMDATAQVTIAHGIADFTKIRSLSAIVRTDADSAYYNLVNGEIGASSGNTQIQAQSTNVLLARAVGGIFDSTSFDSTAFNRGWITVVYEG